MTLRNALLTAVTARAFDTPAGYSPTPEDVAAARANREQISAQSDEMLKRSKDSAAMVEYWDLTDAIVDGIHALRDAGETYLPKFADEENKDYEYRLRMTKLTNVYRDTVESLAAKPFEDEVRFTVEENKTLPEELEKLTEDIDGSGNNLTAFASATFFNGINSAIDWIYVDFPKPNENIRTKADQKAAGIRPYWTHVLGRNVLEVKSTIINGVETLTYVRIYEPGEPDHVRIHERTDTGEIVWQLYKKSDTPSADGKTRFVLIDKGTLSIDVIPLVPFYTGRRDGRSWRFFPVMRDAADLQIELYQQESGLKFAKQLTAYPMLAGNGVSAPKDAAGRPVKLAVGPARVLYAPPNANGHSGTWAYVEPSAQSLKFLADDIKETIQQLRELGRQPLTAQSGNLTVITTAIAAGKAKSAVGAWALALKNALENAAVITCKWLKITADQYDPTVYIYTEFDEFAEGKDIDALNSMRSNGDLSQETYWHEMSRRRVLSDEFDPDIERERLLAETPGDGDDTDLDGKAPPED